MTRPLTIRTLRIAVFLVDELRQADRAAGAGDILDRRGLGDAGRPCMASCMARAVWSQPPPGLAGAMILRLSMAKAPDAVVNPAVRTIAVASLRSVIAFIDSSLSCRIEG